MLGQPSCPQAATQLRVCGGCDVGKRRAESWRMRAVVADDVHV